jgi:hypothetical protein
MVRGEVVTMDDFRNALVDRFGAAQDGRQILENHVTDLAVEAERVKRGVTVTDAEIDAYTKKVEQQLLKASGGAKTLAKLLSEKHVTMAEFEKSVRQFLVRQKLASRDLGAKGEVSQAELGVWIGDLKKKAGIAIGDPTLAPDVYAKVGDTEIHRADYADLLLDKLSLGQKESALWDLVISRVVDQELKAAGLEIADADVDAAVAELEQKFKQDPRFRSTDITFEKYVETVRHITVDQLKKDPTFLAQVGMSKIIRGRFSKDDVKAYWEKHADRYGEARTFVHLLIRGQDKASPFGRVARSMADAKAKIDAVLEEYHRGAPFEELLNKYSEAKSKTIRASDPIVVTLETRIPESLKKAVFSAPVNEVVGPIRTDYGYHLVKVLAVTPAPSFEQAYPTVLEDMIRDARIEEKLKIQQDPAIRLRY